MNKYIFILGQSSDLARQEIVNFFIDEGKIEYLSNNFAIVSTKMDATEIIKNLGGSIKIAEFIETLNDISSLDEKKWFDYLKKDLNPDKKKKPPTLKYIRYTTTSYGKNRYPDVYPPWCKYKTISINTTFK